MDNLHLDGRALRVLAHPLRARLLSELRINGAATATQLAERLSTNTGATSYHLRKLAEVNLVVETGEGTGKQRFWAPAQESHSWSEAELEGDPDAIAASGWLRQHYFNHFGEQLAKWDDQRRFWPVEWRDAAHTSDLMFTATAGELDELMTELESVMTRFSERLGHEPRPGARRVSVTLNAVPIDLDDRP
ncbi:winged helix-turn-helix domain-containing protein [Actinophytocola algeriensis]|uniref:DNA-binding transcriptional ArsR family regulator n=1 Tax=Actinophytocola algeriensis TaxID=1768010 RepID=A0A7W7QEW6_9PSEU|nr:helix-turn-helix domain-containing protein [Actinophytocola algeriensis]MBB4912325.1 DNA-binding transcriptional ArsR family regulator [Actinophytocola algeriensis]MBE1481102.1 DNA-binding transcriptional ArsR family regulator [Actinophytocola algeriensis]